MQYALEDMQGRGGASIARDNKALVHTDVEVVQRPSKSWKRVQYEDHDWAKDTNRTLCITTYQLIKPKKDLLSGGDACTLGQVVVNKAKFAGRGISVVKMSYFEKESVIRHLNETLFIMSNEQFRDHFTGADGRLVSQLLITVDNGGDERPRNKLTHFALVLLRLILDMDRIKTIAYAEHDSKRHSVERYHVAENRALSQGGVISSHSVHEKEIEPDGTFSGTRFRGNMEFAAKEAVSRIDGTPYAGEKMAAFLAPKSEDWVIGEAEEGKIRQFLQRDTDQHRERNNFTLHPSGPIWDKICQMYSVHPSKHPSAARVYNEMTDPGLTWDGHYSFATYRADNEWHSAPCQRYEISPVLDVTQLPAFHYVSYSDASKLNEMFDAETTRPLWLRTPDFYMPSKNIDVAIEQDPTVLSDPDRCQVLSNIIGVTEEEMKKYVAQKEEKGVLKSGRKAIVKRFNDNLGLLTCVQIRAKLTNFGVHLTRQQNKKADLLLALEKELGRRGLDVKEFVEECLWLV
jgi:hypothetical protein